MSRKSLLPQRPRHILVYDEDWDYLTRVFGAGSVNPVGVSPAIRTIIHSYVMLLKQKATDARDGSAGPQPSPTDVEGMVK